MRLLVIVAAGIFLTGGLGSAALFAMGKTPRMEAPAANAETFALKSTQGGCPGGQGFCCRHDQRRLLGALEGVKGVTQVTPDKKTRTFNVVCERGQVTLPDLQQAAREVGFNVTAAKALG